MEGHWEQFPACVGIVEAAPPLQHAAIDVAFPIAFVQLGPEKQKYV